MLNLNPTHTLLRLDSFRPNRTFSLLFAVIFAFVLLGCDKAPDWLKPEPPPKPPLRILELDDPEETTELSETLDPDEPEETTEPSETLDPNDPNASEGTPSSNIEGSPGAVDENPPLQGSSDPKIENSEIDFAEPPNTGLLTTPPIHYSIPGELENEATETDETSTEAGTGTPLSDTESPNASSEELFVTPVDEAVLTESSIPLMEERPETVQPVLEVSESDLENVPAELRAPSPFPVETIEAPALETLLPVLPSEIAAELPDPERALPLPTFGVAMTAQEGEPIPDDPTQLPEETQAEGTTQPEATVPATDETTEEEEAEKDEEEEEEEPFDPIQENGEIFTDWPDPSLALVITGHQNGYLEPCGCAGLDSMKGGLSRRMTLFTELEDQRGWPTIGLDVGGLCKSFGRQAELKFHTSVEAMTLMDYSAIGLGGNDLRLPAQELYARTTNTGSTPSPFLSANVAVYGFALEDMRPYDIIQENGWTIGVTSVLGDQAREELNNSDIETLPAHDQLAEVVPQMLESQCDALVLLAYATIEETEALAEAYPNFNIVATSSGDYEPPTRPRQLNGGRTVLVEVGEKGMNAVVFGFYSEPRKQIRYQRVPLDSRFEASAKARMLMEQYQEQLQMIGFEGLGLRPSPHPDVIPNGNFVGSKACDSCHGDSYDVWKESGHAHAWATLQDLETPRIYDPECISCHTVGWDPEEYFPYESGFWSEETTPKLVNVGCESCHGPGENHIDAEIRGDEPTQLSLRVAMRLTMEEADQSQCITCHDLDNSPDFDFETYWPKIIHDEGIGEDEE